MVVCDCWLGYSQFMAVAEGVFKMEHRDALDYWLDAYHSGRLRHVDGKAKMFCRIPIKII